MGGPQGGIQVKFVIWGYPYFRKCLFIWSEESPVAQLRIGFSQPHHRVLIFSKLNLNHGVILLLFVISPLAVVNPYQRGCGLHQINTDPEIPILLSKQRFYPG